jgi:hypothetical protein
MLTYLFDVSPSSHPYNLLYQTRSLNNGLLYTIGAEVGKRGTEQANLIKENYFQLSLTLSFRDFLFSKGRKYD